MEEHYDSSYEEILNILEEKKGQDYDLRFQLSPDKKDSRTDSDEPTSNGDSEERFWGI
jgi:hypothetical protein